VVFEGSIDDKALVRRKDRDVDWGDILIEACFANVERGFQSLQEGSEFGEFERGSQRRRDSPQLKAGIVRDDHFGFVGHM
jgi:hypothetical protein